MVQVLASEEALELALQKIIKESCSLQSFQNYYWLNFKNTIFSTMSSLYFTLEDQGKRIIIWK